MLLPPPKKIPLRSAPEREFLESWVGSALLQSINYRFKRNEGRITPLPSRIKKELPFLLWEIHSRTPFRRLKETPSPYPTKPLPT